MGLPPFPRTLRQPRPTAALGRRESKVYEDVINGGRTSFLSAPAVAGMLEGGVPILKDGQCLGGGVSGVKVFRRRADCPCRHCRHRPVNAQSRASGSANKKTGRWAGFVVKKQDRREKAWLRGISRWLAKRPCGLLMSLESPHDETHLVRISLPSLVACKRYSEPLWLMATASGLKGAAVHRQHGAISSGRGQNPCWRGHGRTQERGGGQGGLRLCSWKRCNAVDVLMITIRNYFASGF